MKQIIVFFPGVGAAHLMSHENSPYDAVKEIRPLWKESMQKNGSVFADIVIAEILPIHNASGLSMHGQIEEMRAKIKKDIEITEEDGLPNIKLVLAPGSKLLLFDGTHTLLAYFAEGKKILGEVPFLVISSERGEALSEKEIALFFPVEGQKKVLEDWERYVVNWQAEKDTQIEVREVYSIQDLARQLENL